MAGRGWAIPLLPWRLLAANASSSALCWTEPFSNCCCPHHQQEPCFHDEKAPRQWCGPAATAKELKEAILAEWGADIVDLRCRLPVSACKRVNADVYQELLRQHVTDCALRMFPDGKYVFRWIQRRPTSPGPFRGCWQNSGFQRIGRHIYRTWTHWTSLTGAFCSRKSRRCLMLIWTSYFLPSQQNGTI